MKTAWDLLFEAAEDDETPPKKTAENPLLKPTAGPKPGERPTSSTPSAIGVGKGAVAAKDKERTSVAPGAVSKIRPNASTLAKKGISQKKYFSDDDPNSAAQQQMAAGDRKPQRPPAVAQKPPYAGSVPGQTFSRAGQFGSKRTQWTDKASGEKRFGSVQSPTKTDQQIWDGENWVTPREYTQALWNKKMGKKESRMSRSAWDVLVEAMTPVRGDKDVEPIHLPGVHPPTSPNRPGQGMGKKPQQPTMGSQMKPESDMDEANWDKIQKQQNMQRWGSQDRRGDAGVAASRLQKSMAQKKRAQSGAAATALGGIPPQVGQNPIASVPFANDAPTKQVNPLVAPPKKREIESILSMTYGQLVAEADKESGCDDRVNRPTWDLAGEMNDKDAADD